MAFKHIQTEFKEGVATLYQELLKIDSDAAEKINPAQHPSRHQSP
jgi:tRNA A37 N6-isopentenylltransferase MiaA